MNVCLLNLQGQSFFLHLFRPYLKVSTYPAFLGLPGTDSHLNFPTQADFHRTDCMLAKTLKIRSSKKKKKETKKLFYIYTHIMILMEEEYGLKKHADVSNPNKSRQAL